MWSPPPPAAPPSPPTPPTLEIPTTPAPTPLHPQDLVLTPSVKSLMISASWGLISKHSLGLPPQLLMVPVLTTWLLLDRLERILPASVEPTQIITVRFPWNYKSECLVLVVNFLPFSVRWVWSYINRHNFNNKHLCFYYHCEDIQHSCQADILYVFLQVSVKRLIVIKSKHRIRSKNLSSQKIRNCST